MNNDQEKIDKAMMRIALNEAILAAGKGEVPVGAVISDPSDQIIAAAGNNCIDSLDPVGHAEIRVLRLAAQKTGNYRLPGTTVYVTLEPCVMCAGALIHARVKRVVYGAADPKTGALKTRYSIGSDGLLNHSFEICSGILAQECSQVLVDFFRNKR